MQIHIIKLSAIRDWVVEATPRSLYPQERDPILILQEAGWVLGPVWEVRKIFTPDRVSKSKLLMNSDVFKQT
jgi:hypothetical protein